MLQSNIRKAKYLKFQNSLKISNYYNCQFFNYFMCLFLFFTLKKLLSPHSSIGRAIDL